MTDYEMIQKRVPELIKEQNNRRDKAIQELGDRLRESLCKYVKEPVSPELMQAMTIDASKCVMAVSDRVNNIIKPVVTFREENKAFRSGILDVHFVDRQTGVKLNQEQLRELF